MTPPPIPPPSTIDITSKLPLYIDSSMLATLRACPQKFYWNYILNKVPSGESIHLIAGKAFASGVDAARRLQFSADNRNAPLPIDTLSSTAFRAFSKEWGDFQAPSDHAKSLPRVLSSLDLYLSEFHPFTDPVQPIYDDNGNPCSEFSFAIPLPILHPSGEPFIFAGRFDLLGLYNDVPVICDEKTTSALGTYWVNSWDLRGQFIGYAWACRQLGINVSTAIIRGIAIKKTGTDFLPAIVTYPDHLIDRWFEELLNSLEFLKLFEKQGLWTRNFADSCSSYGGCPYKTLCLASNPDAFLTNYQDRTWSPITMED